MSVAGGPKIVTNGLVLCLDAANTKSYPGSGTSWFDLNPTQSVTICGTTTENGTLTLTTPTGYVFTSVDFASYGTPNGSCGSFTTSNCHSTTSYTYVASQLLGKTGSVNISATNANFGDPCGGTPKRLYVQATAASSAAVLINGPTFSNNGNGSIVFDGSNDYAIPPSTILSDGFFQANWTISFWVNFDTLNTIDDGSTDKTLLHHGASGTRQGLHLCQRNNRIHFGLFSDDLQGTIVLSANTWYNIVFTLNNSTLLKQNYLNGSFNNSQTGAGAYIGTGTNARISGPALTFGSYFDGFMSNCMFYNRVLSASEILQNYNATKGRFRL